MDFRSAQPQATGTAPVSAGGAGKGKRGRDGAKLVRAGVVTLLFCLTILVVATIFAVAFNKTNNQSKFVKSDDYQAVFLTNGQVYFGNISDVNKDYIRLGNIFYLTQNTTTSSSGQTTTDGNYTLVKLGCQQIHDPLDEMVIQQNQVSFWENLNGSGKVVTSIKQFQKQNPKGPDCSQVSNQTQASSTSNNTTTNQSTTDTTTTKP
jgi:hypothetical protein